MVYLYGVTHGGRWTDFFTGHAEEMDISPTRELIADLSKFPRGTKVGFEFMSKQDWGDVQSHLLALPFHPPDPRFEDLEFASRPCYRVGKDNYWAKLEMVCSSLGFDVVFLDDKSLWLEYNKAIIKATKNEARRSNLFVREKGETNKHYNLKRISFNEEKYREEISARKIHEIDRDNQLLDAIRTLSIDVAFVGYGHSEYWMVHRQDIKSNFRLDFEGYSAEIPKVDAQLWEGSTFFVKDAQPNLRVAFIRTGLERSIRLLGTGRLSDRKPDFIGTWDISNPSRGYFEMFVTRNGKAIHGEIVDCLGDGDFEGEVKNREMRFVKKYRQDRCSEGASLKEIAYKGIVRNGQIIGYFVIRGYGELFYATQQPADDLVDLGMSWNLSAKRYKKGIASLSRRLFEK